MKKYIERICDEFAKERNFSGVCMLKIKGETIFSKAYGYANRSFKISNRIDTKFDTASITKLFTAVAILQLIEQNRLNFFDKITEVIDLSDTMIPSDVTIEQLLNHTSGIADDAEEEAGEEYSDLFLEHPNYALRECKDFLKNFAYKKPNFKAGTNVRYCNCSFVLLGLAIEKIMGMNYRDYVAHHVFEKANMKNTGFFAMDEINENIAEGYKNVEDEEGRFLGYKKNIYSYPPKGTPDGGAYTTAEDLNKFLIAIKENVLLGDEYSRLLLMPHCEFKRDAEWLGVPNIYEKNGYAFEYLLFEQEESPFCMYKDGQNDGVASRFSYYPKEDISLVLLANQDCDVWEMTKLIQLEIYHRYYS